MGAMTSDHRGELAATGERSGSVLGFLLSLNTELIVSMEISASQSVSKGFVTAGTRR